LGLLRDQRAVWAVCEGDEAREPDNKVWKEEGRPEHPVVNVSWDDAVAYGKWAGLELPSEAQWRRQRGVRWAVYPWGGECGGGESAGTLATRASGVDGGGERYPNGVSWIGTYSRGTCGNGARTGTTKTTTRRVLGGIPRGRRQARAGVPGRELEDVDASFFRGSIRGIFGPRLPHRLSLVFVS